MTWLKKVGSVMERALPIILGIAGVVLPGIGGSAGTIAKKVLGDLNGIPSILVGVENAFNNIGAQKSGSDKLKAAAPLVQQLIIDWVTANEPGTAKIQDPAKLATAAAQITSGFADALNSFGA